MFNSRIRLIFAISFAVLIGGVVALRVNDTDPSPQAGKQTVKERFATRQDNAELPQLEDAASFDREAPDLARSREVLREAILLGDSLETRTMVDEALASLAPENVNEFREVFTLLPEHGDYRYALERFAETWAAFDGASAVEFVLVEEDAQTIESDAARLAMTVWASYDMEAAESFVQGYPKGGEREVAYTVFAYAKVANGREEAILWAETQDKQSDRRLAARGLGGALASADLGLATKWVGSLGEAVQARDGANSVAYEWAKTDPLASLQWALEQDIRIVKKYALKGALLRWSEDNASDAAQWLSETQASSIDDALLDSFIRGSYKSDPDIAHALVGTLKSESQKRKLRSQIEGYWQTIDPEGYRKRVVDQ